MAGMVVLVVGVVVNNWSRSLWSTRKKGQVKPYGEGGAE